MTYEEAYYRKMLIMAGFTDGYDDWLDSYLNKENPLSQIVLNLADCGADINKIISVLHNFCEDKEIDENAVCEMLRLFLKNEYNAKRIDKDRCILAMYRFAVNSENQYEHPWSDMALLSDYYELVTDGIGTHEMFDKIFLPYINNGAHVKSLFDYN